MLSTVRPRNNKTDLNLKDIKPGLRIQRWHRGDMTEIVTVASLPYFGHQTEMAGTEPNTIWVDVETLYGNEKRSLGDMGIVAYDNGMWNDVNYATKAESLKPVELEGDDAIDFFRAVEQWLDQMFNNDSPYRWERKVNIVIPQKLRAIIKEHTVTRSVRSPYLLAKRVAVSFV